MKRILWIIGMLVSGIVMGFSHITQYESKYDLMFQYLNAQNSNEIVLQFDEGVKKDDLDLVYSALKKIGQTKLTNAKSRVKDALVMGNPVLNNYKAKQVAQLRYIFHIAIWAIGQIGDNKDIEALAYYIPKLKDTETLYYLFEAMGNFNESDFVLTTLHELTASIRVESLAKAIVDSLVKLNNRKSIYYLILMKQKAVFNNEFRDYIDKAIEQLHKNGK